MGKYGLSVLLAMLGKCVKFISASKKRYPYVIPCTYGLAVRQPLPKVKTSPGMGKALVWFRCSVVRIFGYWYETRQSLVHLMVNRAGAYIPALSLARSRQSGSGEYLSSSDCPNLVRVKPSPPTICGSASPEMWVCQNLFV